MQSATSQVCKLCKSKFDFGICSPFKDERLQCFNDVDSVLLSVQKMLQYSNVNSEFFGEEKLELLKVSKTIWLSHGEGC